MDVRDWLYLETDDSCATCGARGDHLLTIHHIDGDRSNNAYDNQIVLCHNCHEPYHQKSRQKGTISVIQVTERKRRLIMKTLTQYGVNALKMASRNEFGMVAMAFLLYHLVGLGYMKQEEGIIQYGEQRDFALNRFTITAEGRQLADRWLR